jgi:hypothetical protein
VVAGLEVITPRLTAEQVFTNKVLSHTGENLIFETDGGNFIFKSREASNSAEIVTGGLTADWIKASRIEGLEVLSDRFSGLEGKVASLSAEMEITPTPGLVVGASNLADETVFKKIRFDTGLAQLSLNVSGDLTVGSGITVKGQALFDGNVTFNNGVTFGNSPIFGKDVAGLAVIKTGSNRVDIVFDKEYPEPPIVFANISFDLLKNGEGQTDDSANNNLEGKILANNYTYILTRKTTKGFTIVINKNASEDVTFSWTALSVKNPRLFTGMPSDIEPIITGIEPATPTQIPPIGLELISPTPEVLATSSAVIN